MLLTLSCWRCQSAGNHSTGGGAEIISITFPDTSSLKDLSGEQLAYAYCQQCHMLPEPALLSKEIWKNGVLPRMGERLGISTGRNPYSGLSYEEINKVVQAGIFPDEKKITEKAWQKLIDFYLANAPDSIAPLTGQEETFQELPFFSASEVTLDKVSLPLITLVKFDPESEQLWIGSARNHIKMLDGALKVADSLQTNSPPIDIVSSSRGKYLLEIGILNPSDQEKGLLMQLNREGKAQTLLAGLSRPVHLSIADLNLDGHPDYVISNFGNLLGNLSWYERNGEDSMQQHILSQYPGARKTVIYDFNQDGLPDIMALMAQGDERMVLFYNKGAGHFEPKTILRFPPVYGSSYFEVADFNQDGKMDILYANGDNADLSFTLKNYHGIRIFENQGREHFQEKFFYPIYGATAAKAKDFDQDGDLDIAVLAYFADFDHTPEKGFIYLENNSKETYKFKAFTFPEAKKGRWLTFDTGDIDDDGDEDIILGSFAFRTTPVPVALQKEWIDNGPDLMVLKNCLY